MTICMGLMRYSTWGNDIRRPHLSSSISYIILPFKTNVLEIEERTSSQRHPFASQGINQERPLKRKQLIYQLLRDIQEIITTRLEFSPHLIAFHFIITQ